MLELDLHHSNYNLILELRDNFIKIFRKAFSEDQYLKEHLVKIASLYQKSDGRFTLVLLFYVI